MTEPPVIPAPEVPEAAPVHPVVPEFSVVIPVYGNEGTLGAVIERLEGVAARLPGPLEAVFVVDGSPTARCSSSSGCCPRRRSPARSSCTRGTSARSPPSEPGWRRRAAYPCPS